jgi:hypothetical protein
MAPPIVPLFVLIMRVLNDGTEPFRQFVPHLCHDNAAAR